MHPRHADPAKMEALVANSERSEDESQACNPIIEKMTQTQDAIEVLQHRREWRDEKAQRRSCSLCSILLGVILEDRKERRERPETFQQPGKRKIPPLPQPLPGTESGAGRMRISPPLRFGEGAGGRGLFHKHAGKS